MWLAENRWISEAVDNPIFHDYDEWICNILSGISTYKAVIVSCVWVFVSLGCSDFRK